MSATTEILVTPCQTVTATTGRLVPLEPALGPGGAKFLRQVLADHAAWTEVGTNRWSHHQPQAAVAEAPVVDIELSLVDDVAMVLVSQTRTVTVGDDADVEARIVSEMILVVNEVIVEGMARRLAPLLCGFAASRLKLEPGDLTVRSERGFLELEAPVVRITVEPDLQLLSSGITVEPADW